MPERGAVYSIKSRGKQAYDADDRRWTIVEIGARIIAATFLAALAFAAWWYFHAR